MVAAAPELNGCVAQKQRIVTAKAVQIRYYFSHIGQQAIVFADRSVRRTEVNCGFNMSWIFVDGINEDALFDALDLAATGVTPDEHDLGTSHVPLAGASLKSGWCAVFAQYALVMDATVGTNPARLMRLPARSRCITCVVLEHAMVSYASLWQEGRFPEGALGRRARCRRLSPTATRCRPR